MKSILIDAGPLIALFDRSDRYHEKALDFVREFQGQLWTTWPVVTEVSHMLDFSTKAQVAFLQWIERGGLRLFDLNEKHAGRLVELTQKFNDVPMDLADASLVIAAEEKKQKEIATIDSDFYIYRDIRNQYLTNIFM
ncbi:MAG: PIN domain-containing protein [Reichenbachiella sp.]|uniref:type II toxin-antitoxin system VapC family toxin n=1 Tax=Reichenbachiella sp. TaxID=2184521 RepID=UPI0029660E4B|nr:PIN domain-containing protein [Reichenbachiella sp.]MDW3211946.1 PIN domain-containing protein [Reichenbachiella sp.]